MWSISWFCCCCFLAFDFCPFCVVTCFFLSPPQRPMTSDFERFYNPDFIHYIYFPILILNSIRQFYIRCMCIIMFKLLKIDHGALKVFRKVPNRMFNLSFFHGLTIQKLHNLNNPAYSKYRVTVVDLHWLTKSFLKVINTVLIARESDKYTLPPDGWSLPPPYCPYLRVLYTNIDQTLMNWIVK